jgi:hypothetical protein
VSWLAIEEQAMVDIERMKQMAKRWRADERLVAAFITRRLSGKKL